MQSVEIKTNGYRVEQRRTETMRKGERLKCDEDLCFILLPSDWKNKNVIVILTEE